MKNINDLTPAKKEFVVLASKKFGDGAILTRNQINEFAKEAGVPAPSWLKKNEYRVGHGQYQLPTDSDSSASDTPDVPMTPQVDTNQPETRVNLVVDTETQNLIPSHFEGFVPWGHCSTIKKIIQSRMFYPVFITGLSGNGKTLMVEELHSQLKKELIRVNITIETDEDDLLGGFRLINGETKFVPGPVIQAMERGCTLLLDECDLGSNKLLALQPVLEGKGVFLKKINKWVTPKPGFNVIATANTKGRGSDDGRFSAATIIDEAFLERFVSAVNQPWPSKGIEKKIVKNHMTKFDAMDEDFLEKLITWASIIRKTFEADGVDEVVSTRRLCHVIKTFSIFKDRVKSVEMCINLTFFL